MPLLRRPLALPFRAGTGAARKVGPPASTQDIAECQPHLHRKPVVKCTSEGRKCALNPNRLNKSPTHFRSSLYLERAKIILSERLHKFPLHQSSVHERLSNTNEIASACSIHNDSHVISTMSPYISKFRRFYSSASHSTPCSSSLQILPSSCSPICYRRRRDSWVWR